MTNFTKFVVFFSCFIFFYGASSQSIIKTLPGYSGNLPFKLETGYITVGESDDRELFYYFIESERNPNDDPLLLWLTGGPGCSGLCGLTFELGPIAFDASSFNGSLPSFVLREHSWTKIANVIFIDSPVGTGFSYGTKPNSYNITDTISAADTYTFLRKWLLKHPMFIENDMYIAGDSYAGKIVPIVVLDILNGNEAGLEPQMPLQGYLIGNPITNEHDNNERIPYAHGMALISTEYYESAKSSCSGQYTNPDPSNAQCLHDLDLINKCLRYIYTFHILEPTCSYEGKRRGLMFLEEDWQDILLSSDQDKPICRDTMDYMMSYAWANNQEVQDALHVRKGTIKEWKKCNTLTPAYVQNVASAVPYHQLLTHKIPKALIYSGDHDLLVPYLATLKWIQLLNLTVDETWRPWKVNGQVAGYTQRYKKDEFCLTFATVKGAGHTVPEFKPEESLAMVDRWISSNPL